MRQMSKLIFRSYRRYYDGAKAVAVPMNITGTSSSRPQGQRSNVPCLRITQPIAALGWSNNNSYGNFTKARISSSERKSRTTKKSTTPSWAADLSRFVTTENKKNKDKISTIVSKWTYKTFETKLPNEIFDYIFNELDSRPSEVMKAVSIDIFKELLVDLLDRCATESLCTLFEERCLNAKKILMKKKLLEKYTDYYDEMAIFARDSKKKKENINEPIEMTIVSKTSRIASIVYGINDKTKLHSEFDLIRFKDRVDELFEWFGAEDPKNGDLKTCKTYLAPYFPLIQSSGTGKTLLLDKFNREAKKSKDTYCELFLCVPDIYGSEIHKQLEIDNMQTGGQPDRDKTWKYLNSLLPDDPTIKKVIFLFDEAHILLEDSALLFRYIRWWLREKGRQQQVVAVFTGTTSKLSTGPCVIENREVTFLTAERIVEVTSKLNIPFIFKASFKKANRTSLNSFTGLNYEESLQILNEIKEKFEVPILTDIHSTNDVPIVSTIADVLQIPAFLCRQTDLLIEAGKSGKVVNVKKGQFLAPEDMKHVIEKIESTGNKNIWLTERGTTFGYHNLVVDMRGLVTMKEFGYPVVMDATHSVQMPSSSNITGGEPKFIEPLSKAAAAVGIDALFLEVHPDPKNALSDSGSQLHIDKLESLLERVIKIDKVVKGY